LGGVFSDFFTNATHRAGVRHSQVWSEQLHSLGVPDESGDESRCEGENFRLYALVEEGYGPGHSGSIAYSLCRLIGILNDV
jgi:hypothetical protein